ncbi:hypothetical protein PRIPAC_91292 [Pristionchus pacificus]|uniref:TPT domain-containing protein n=1 Tax=Pristionchus pacificus TaxID=54126 RepID=A0A2A6B9S1_PRIPA|nr:hypothetical protein PRIPAC_91292 [Pristionchus pacificus]|eukprot:PDM62632.1 hypothetical protein PRIPAC_52074 [Pristionchus pacificus]
MPRPDPDDPLEEIDLTFIRSRAPVGETGSAEELEVATQAQSTGWMMVLRIAAMAALYYPLSIGLTFYQKWFIKQYRLPLLVVTGHYFTKWFLAIFIRFLFECRRSRRVRLTARDQLRWLAPIGVCASLDIGLSNWALEYVTVSLYTMAKSSSIVFIVAFSLLLRLERWRASLGLEAALIAVGLFLFTFRSAQLDLNGLMLVELAAACTGVRWTVSQLVMQREDHGVRHPLDMVAHVQPWMVIPILPLVWMFEGSEISWESITKFHGVHDPWTVLLLILTGGTIAFAMELSEYLLLVNTSGITLSIFGIIKEVATLILAAVINGDRFSPVNIAGLSLCLAGMAIHSISAKRKQKKSYGVASSLAMSCLIARSLNLFSAQIRSSRGIRRHLVRCQLALMIYEDYSMKRPERSPIPIDGCVIYRSLRMNLFPLL